MKTIEQDDVLQLLKDKAPRAMHVGEIIKRLRLDSGQREDVLQALLLLVEMGHARELPGARFRSQTPVGKANTAKKKARKQKERSTGKRSKRPPRENATPQGPFTPPIPGRLTMTPRGFGFVILDEGGPDVFIPPDRVGASMHGDRVNVRAQPSPKGRDGYIVGILERGPKEITGIVQGTGRSQIFIPDDERLRSPMKVDEKVPRKMQRGATILAEISEYPQVSDDRPTVRLLNVLGKEGVTEIEVTKIKIREGIVEDFPQDVMQEASQLPARVTKADAKGRKDFRNVDLVTIDPASAKDHDDALWATRLPSGGFKIVVAIADVSHYVQPGTATDREAIARGTSIYLPDRSIPMLPRALSSDLASLVPGKDRLCMAIEMELSAQGTVKSHHFSEGLMRSGAKLTYEGAARALGLTESGPRQPGAEKRLPALEALLEAAGILRKRRLRRGALDFDLPEPKIIMDERKNEPKAIEQAKHDPGIRQAYRMVEEMMLLANEVVARELTHREIPAIYRAHGKPDLEKVELFCKLAQSLGYDLDPDSARDSKQLSKFLQSIDGTEQAPILRYMLLRSMQQAVYDTDPSIGHFGLASPDYLHFTSPIRRYPDLAVHRMLKGLIRGQKVDVALIKPKLQRACVEASRLERRAMSVERDVSDLYRVVFMQAHVGNEYDAKISGFSQRGIYVTVADPFVDMMLPLDQLDDSFQPDDLGIRLIGQRSATVFTLGDKVRIRLEEANVRSRDLIVSLLDHQPTSKKPKQQRAAKPAPKSRSPKGKKPRATQPRKRRRNTRR